MHPVLFELPWGTANAYGTLILLGGLSSLPGTWWDARARGMGRDSTASFVVDLWLVIIFGAAIGGRILHILTMPGPYLEDPRRALALETTGFVFFGSLSAIALGFVWLARRHGTTFGAVCDLSATWMGLGHAFGRMGCWFAGCCWGAPTEAALGVSFPPESVVVLTGGAPLIEGHTVALHPTQLYEAGGLSAIFVVLLAIRLRRGPEPTWRQASRYAIAYGCLRTVVEVFRGDRSRGFLFELSWPGGAEALGLPADHPLGLSVSQAVALALVGLGLWGLRRTRVPPPPAAAA